MATYSNTAREVEMPNGDVVVVHSEPTGGANSTSNIKKFTYDDNGHITGSDAADAEDLNLSSYSTPTTGTTAIGTSDALQTAIGKLDHQSQIDQTNILYALETGVKNIAKPIELSDISIPSGLTITTDGKGHFDLSGTTQGTFVIDLLDAGTGLYCHNDVYIKKATSKSNIENYTVKYTDSSSATQYRLIGVGTGGIILEAGNTINRIYLQKTTSGTSVSVSASVDLFICDKRIENTASEFEPYALSNSDLTELEAEDRKNALYAIKTGVKNLLNFDLDVLKSVNTSGTWNNNVYTLNSVTFTVNDDNTISVSAGSSHAYTAFVLCSNTADAGNRKRFLNNSPLYLTGGVSGNVNVSVYSPTGTGGSVTSASMDADTDLTFTNTSSDYNIHIRVAENEAVDATLKPMIRSQMVSDRTYQPFALSNADLTQLESEDRAALAEEIDAGAKNLFDLSVKEAAKTANITVSKTTDSITVTSDTSGNESYVSYPIVIDKAGKYVITATFSNVNLERTSAILRFSNTATGGVVYTLTISSNGTLSGEFEVSTAGTYWLLFAPNWSSDTAVNTYTASEIMVCTKAAYDVSQSYAPYRKNLDQLEATKAPALSPDATIRSGSLNDVAVNTFAMYTTDVSNLPNTASYFYVETIIFSALYALQKAYSIADGTSYTRVKDGGAWKAWKQSSNA